MASAPRTPFLDILRELVRAFDLPRGHKRRRAVTVAMGHARAAVGLARNVCARCLQVGYRYGEGNCPCGDLQGHTAGELSMREQLRDMGGAR